MRRCADRAFQLFKCLFLSTLIGVVHGVEITPRTYQLIFDAVVSHEIVAHHALNPQNSNPSEPHHQLVPPTIATDVAATIGSDFLAVWLKRPKKHDAKETIGEESGAALGLNCFPGEGSSENAALSTTCFVDHAERDISFQVSVKIYSPYSYFETDDAAEENKLRNKNFQQRHSVPVAARVDATFQGPGAKFALVNAVPKLIKLLQSPSHPPPVWAIQERPCSSEMADRFLNAYNSATQTDRQREQLSVESLVLSNRNLIGRIPVVTQEEDDIEIWHSTEIGEQETVRSLFVKSILRATTSRRVARSLLYPGFFDKAVRLRLDRPNVKVALVSEVPLAMIATILEHTSVTRLDIIGSDESLQDFIANYMPKLSQCGTSGESGAGNCLEDERVYFINMDIDEWMHLDGGGGHATALYNVIFLDEESFGMEDFSFGSKLVDGGLVVGSVTGIGEETDYRYHQSVAGVHVKYMYDEL